MTGMLGHTLSAARHHRGSLVGGFAVLALAAALLTVTGAWIQAGIVLVRDGSSMQGSALLGVAGSFAGTTAIVAVFLVASAFGQSLRQRAAQFALLRTVGATPAQVRRMIAGELLAVFLAAAPLGAIAGTVLAPLPSGVLAANGLVPAGFALPASPYPGLGASALLLPTVLCAAWLVSRPITRPAALAATRGSATEDSSIGRGRAIAAVSTAVLGAASATLAFVAGGMAGAATAASSALLLIIATALAGPVLVGRISRWADAALRERAGAAATLALRSARGHSRRLTGAIMPLALLFALGLVQVGSGEILTRAAEVQLRDALDADLVVTGARPDDLAAVERLPGVASAGWTGSFPASVRTDADERTGIPLLDALSWEQAVLTVVPASEGLAPRVSSGSLSELAAADAIALSSEAALGMFAPVGGSVQIRTTDGVTVVARIVATYEGGALGDYLVGPDFPGAEAADTGAVLVATEDGARADVQRQLDALGVNAVGVEVYVQDAVTAGAADQLLSTGATLVLLAFIALAAANTLVMLTTARSREFRLLHRTGMSRRQIVGMIGIEALFVVVLAIVLGAASSLPALLGIGWGLLGSPQLGLDAAPVAALALAVVVIAFGSLTPTAMAMTRPRRTPRSRVQLPARR